MYNRCYRSGFTLIEMSIVIVIIGLIVGGILGGQELIQQTKSQQIISKNEEYKLAVSNFLNSYQSLPGDTNKASTFWPVDCVDSGSNYCDGDNDNTIEYGSGSEYEALRVWQHMDLAGILETGLTALFPASTHGIGGYNMPKAPVENGVFFFSYRALYTTNYIGLGGERPSASPYAPTYGVLKPIAAYAIDKKIDDGIANTGDVFGEDGGDGTTCRDAGDPTYYDLDLDAIGCWMEFNYRF